jgi:hypothetical protein
LNVSSIVRAVENKGDVYILGYYDSSKDGYECGITKITKDGYAILPTTYLSNGVEKKLYYSSNNIVFDKNDNLWIAGKKLYCFKDGAWTEHFINDEYKDLRIIEQHCIDIYGNIWFQTWVNINSGKGFTEIYKYDGTKFSKVFGTNFQMSFAPLRGPNFSNQTITPLSDGRVMIFRYRGPSDDDWEEGEDNGEILIFDQDGKQTYLKIKTNDSAEFTDWSKYVVSIFEDSQNKFWFNLEFMYWKDDLTGPFHYCCGGLSLYDNGQWTVFDDSKGLPRYNSETLNSTYNTLKYKDTVLIQTPSEIYSIKNNVLSPMDKKYIAEHSYLIPANSHFAIDSNYSKYWEGFFTNQSYFPSFSPMFSNNNELWLVTEKGILVIDPTINGIEENIENFEIYPNPVVNNISFPDNFINYEILNLSGEILQSGCNSEKINISRLYKGIYFIRLVDLNNNVVVKKFIKNY